MTWQRPAALLAAALAAAFAWSSEAAVAAAVAAAARSTPVSRVVELLHHLQEKLEGDLKTEEKAFLKYKCWYSTVKSAKEASNAAADSRINSLTAYVADIEAGKIEFTTERVDLEKQIAGLNGDLQQAADLRAKEASDFAAAEQELQQAKTALGEAVRVLAEGTSASLSQEGVRLTARWSLRQALRYAHGSLAAEDERVLQELVGGAVPNKDWKKLNREATFKKKYAARSGGIIKVLTELEATFSKNLEEARAKESAAQSTYDGLKASKEKMLETAQAALTTLAEENGARGLSKAEAQQELEALRGQVEADNDFLNDVKDSFEAKEKEWQAREALRNKELKGISEAIAVLHSDDARDTFKKAYASQGFSFLEEEHRPRRHRGHHHHRGHHGHRDVKADEAAVPRTLAALAQASGDRRLSSLASMALSSGSIASVITAIDNLVGVLQSEEQQDLETKEQCEADLASNSRDAKLKSVAIDGLSDEIARHREKVTELEGEIEEQEKAIAESNSSLQELVRQKEDETRRFDIEQRDNNEAVALLTSALQVLQKMATEVGSAPSLLAIAPHKQATNAAADAAAKAPASKDPAPQVPKTAPQKRGALVVARLKRQPIKVVAGEAPPPPPATWEDPTYTGAAGETSGILSILELVKQDVEKDIATAEDAMKKYNDEFDKAKGDLEKSMQDARDAISAYDAEKANEQQSAIDKDGQRTTAKGELASTMDLLKGLKPGCDYNLINYDVRVKKRQIEIDGLTKAKAYLQGGTFAS